MLDLAIPPIVAPLDPMPVTRRLSIRSCRPSLVDLRFKGDPWVVASERQAAVCLGDTRGRLDLLQQRGVERRRNLIAKKYILGLTLSRACNAHHHIGSRSGWFGLSVVRIAHQIDEVDRQGCVGQGRRYNRPPMGRRCRGCRSGRRRRRLSVR